MKQHKVSGLRRYYCMIRSWLPCPRRLKEMILGDINENVAAFLEENPGAGIDQIEGHFGKPQQIAADYVSDLDMPKLLHTLRLRKRIFTVVITAVSIALVTALLMWGWGIRQSIIETQNESNGYFSEEIIIH